VNRVFNILFSIIAFYLALSWIADNPQLVSQARDGVDSAIKRTLSKIK
jgi:hypothetical protein|tara:strand:+ start:2227 stop:2370 length:144 start_codon:yes stop_codon:yes gene_type:complete